MLRFVTFGTLATVFFIISVPGTKVTASPFEKPQDEPDPGTVFLRYLFLFIFMCSFGFPKGTQLKMTSLRGGDIRDAEKPQDEPDPGTLIKIKTVN